MAPDNHEGSSTMACKRGSNVEHPKRSLEESGHRGEESNRHYRRHAGGWRDAQIQSDLVRSRNREKERTRARTTKRNGSPDGPMRTGAMSGGWRRIDQSMSSASPWIATNDPGQCHGRAILRTEAAIGRRREKPVTILYAEAVVEMEKPRSWKSILSGQGLTIGEMQNHDGRDDCIEGPVTP